MLQNQLNYQEEKVVNRVLTGPANNQTVLALRQGASPRDHT